MREATKRNTWGQSLCNCVDFKLDGPPVVTVDRSYGSNKRKVKLVPLFMSLCMQH